MQIHLGITLEKCIEDVKNIIRADTNIRFKEPKNLRCSPWPRHRGRWAATRPPACSRRTRPCRPDRAAGRTWCYTFCRRWGCCWRPPASPPPPPSSGPAAPNTLSQVTGSMSVWGFCHMWTFPNPVWEFIRYIHKYTNINTYSFPNTLNPKWFDPPFPRPPVTPHAFGSIRSGQWAQAQLDRRVVPATASGDWQIELRAKIQLLLLHSIPR